LNPMMMALDASAKSTSPSVIPPGVAWRITTLTSSVLRSVRCFLRTSTEPCTSALTISLSSLTWPASMRVNRLSSVTWVRWARALSRPRLWASSAAAFARLMSFRQ